MSGKPGHQRPLPSRQGLILSGASLPNIPLLAARAAPAMDLRYQNGDVELAEYLGEDAAAAQERLGATHLKQEMQNWLGLMVLHREMLLSLRPERLLVGDVLPRLQEANIVLVPQISLDEALALQHRAWGERYHRREQRAILLESLRAEETLLAKDGVLPLALGGLTLAERVARLVAFWQGGADLR